MFFIVLQKAPNKHLLTRTKRKVKVKRWILLVPFYKTLMFRVAWSRLHLTKRNRPSISRSFLSTNNNYNNSNQLNIMSTNNDNTHSFSSSIKPKLKTKNQESLRKKRTFLRAEQRRSFLGDKSQLSPCY